MTSKHTVMPRWSIAFWVILPLTMFDTQKRHVLVQGISGSGAYVMIDETMSLISVVCEEDDEDDRHHHHGDVVVPPEELAARKRAKTKHKMLHPDECKKATAEVDLTTVEKGWHHFVITCDNLHSGCEGQIKFVLDGEQVGEPQTGFCMQPISYIGNSKDGGSPFGPVCDLRIYPYVLRPKQIEPLATYHPDLEFEMCDKFSTCFVENGLVGGLINDLKHYSRPNIICVLL